MITPSEASAIVVAATGSACNQINEFSKTVLQTRGGRLGSGMGSLLEALWGYYINQALLGEGGDAATCEIGWIDAHDYNDFACVHRNQPWVEATKSGELFRIEAKSMNVEVDESKGHFDELSRNLTLWELLLVLIWRWEPMDEFHVHPRIIDYFIGPARPIAELRDALHETRGGLFVDRNHCPDGCASNACTHHGEPLNAKKKRERLSGPEACRPSLKNAYAANFGGLVRMLKTDSNAARQRFRSIRASEKVAHEYISFIHRNYPAEESNQYTAEEWRDLAARLGLAVQGMSKADIIRRIRTTIPEYREELRKLYVANQLSLPNGEN